MSAIKTLMDEHDNILKMLDVVHNASLNLLSDGTISTRDFRQIVDFIRLYADKTHHGKEEEFLFKMMSDELGAVADNLVKHGMMVEHDIARLYVSDLETALNAYDENPSDKSKLAILVAAGSYEQLLRRHIQKENDVVFPFAEKSLSNLSLDYLNKQTLDFNCNNKNAAVCDEQLHVLKELLYKYIV